MAVNLRPEKLVAEAVAQFIKTGKLRFLADISPNKKKIYIPEHYCFIIGTVMRCVDSNFFCAFTRALNKRPEVKKWHFEEILGLIENKKLIKLLEWGEKHNLGPNQRLVFLGRTALEGSEIAKKIMQIKPYLNNEMDEKSQKQNSLDRKS